MDKNKAENADFLMDDDEEETLSIVDSGNDEIFESNVSNPTASEEKVFENDIEPLVFNVMEMHFSVGEIFWTMSSGKKITLFHPGDWIRKDYLKIYQILEDLLGQQIL